MAPIGCHTFRATGISAYLATGGALGTRKKWPRMRARAPLGSTTGRLTQDEVERIRL
jgi:hypothetical protein